MRQSANRIKSGDTVLLISGKDRGKTGVVQRVLPRENRVVVAGANIIKKSVRRSRKNPRGGFADLPIPMHISNVLIVCPNCGKPTRVGFQMIQGKSELKRVRVCRKCGKVILREVKS